MVEKKDRTVLRRSARIVAAVFVLLFIGALVTTFCINGAVVRGAKGKVYTLDSLPAGSYDAILVLGAGVKPDGTPSDMLRDRIDTGVRAYEAGLSPVLLMSGDSQNAEKYDETGTMKRVAEDAGVPEDAILTDGLGLSTAESLRRARDLYGCHRILIVTQDYHLPRAISIAEALGMEAEGLDAALNTYRGQWIRDLREIAARVKDYIFVK